MTTNWLGRFRDREIERQFQLDERQARLPFVRAYAVLAGLILLGYGAVNPLFVAGANQLWLAELQVPTLLLLGTYFGLTFWKHYPRIAAIDFVALLALALLVSLDNVLISSELGGSGSGGYVSLAINGLIVSAFAAVAFAGRTGWFLLWLAAHAAAVSQVLVRVETTPVTRAYSLLSYVTGALVVLFLNWMLGRLHRARFRLRRALDAERAKNEEMLYNVLPPAAVERLKAGQVVADSFSDASVIFIDVVGFTRLSKAVSPGHLIDLLNALFGVADRCAADAGVEKVKTIGDAYLAVAGGNAPAANSAETAIRFARAVLAGLDAVRASTGLDLQVRVGIHSGPLVGGVIGATRMSYDYWGETMNFASRIQASAEPGGIAVSESSYLRAKSAFEFAAPETMLLKGIGEVPVYRLAR